MSENLAYLAASGVNWNSILQSAGIWAGITGGIAAVIAVVPMTRGAFLAIYRLSRRRRLEALVGEAELNVKVDTAGLQPGEQLSAEDRRFIGYSKQRDEAEHELGPYLPNNPRRAKRIMNHERLYAQIAEDRSIFGGDPELTHRHLAKWILILERWPRLGAALTQEPSMMQMIEKCDSAQQLQEFFDQSITGLRATDELLGFLRRGVPLSPILQRLVRFEP